MWYWLLIFVFFWRTYNFFKTLSKQLVSSKKIKTMCILGSGGHTLEMIEILKTMEEEDYEFHYVVANTDLSSIPKLESSKIGRIGPYYQIPRSRSVKQSYFTSIFTTIYSIFYSFFIYYKIQPDLILCNGPGTSIPLLIISFFFKTPRIFYVESIARVKDLSLTGKIIYHTKLFSKFIVQWESLKEKYPRSEYLGRIV